MSWAQWSNVGGEGLDLSDNNRGINGDVLSDYEASAGSDVQACTITRIRGHLWWVPAATLTQEYTGLAVGFAIGNKSDVANLTDTQQANRANNPYRDWMYYKRIQTASGAAESATGAFSTMGWQNELDVDIKSQRKFDELDETLHAWFGLTDTVGSGNSIKLFYDFRVLIKHV